MHPTKKDLKTKKHSAAKTALQQAKASSDGYVRVEDLKGVPPSTAAKALSRLAAKGLLVRAAKGLYYMPRETLLGKSRPSEVSVVRERFAGNYRPTGVTAANLLGLTTQVSARPELALYASARPKGLESTKVTLRKRPRTAQLNEPLAAVLETLRNGGKFSELDTQNTVHRVRATLSSSLGENNFKSWRKITEASLSEPPRVRAILGALMEEMNLPESVWGPLRQSLNPLTKFNFGLFRELQNAKRWQAK